MNKFNTDHDEGLMKNYEMVISGDSGKHIGPPWYDGLINEVIRGLSDIISINYDRSIDEQIEAYVALIKKAQEISKDGYINTYTTLICPDQKWGKNGGSLLWQHEIYNIGCLVEAGVHYYQATGKMDLLACAISATNCLCATIGSSPKENIIPAHSLPEEAILKLYRLLKDENELITTINQQYSLVASPDDYLNLVTFWYDNRGVHYNRASFPHYMGEYAQDHCTIEHQHEAVGHAVRAALMYTGLATLGIEKMDNKYIDISNRIWDNVIQTKLHVSGGIGAIHNEERFGFQYDLPNDAYLETCAGVAMMFWAHELFRSNPNSKYIDVLERALYNNVLPGLSIDGQKYFYENPLTSDGSIERWSWHGCPCCPPMLLKAMGSLQDFIYSINDTKIYVNLFIGSKFDFVIEKENISVEQVECKLPLVGSNKLVVDLEVEKNFTIAIRKPDWAPNMILTIQNEMYETNLDNGYIEINRLWHKGDTIDIKIDLIPTKVEAHPFVKQNRGKIALFRGPLMYCLEEVDNNTDINEIILGNNRLNTNKTNIVDTQTVAITGIDNNNCVFTAVPYYLWNNRDVGKMEVWIKQIKPNEEIDFELSTNGTPFAAHTSTPLTISNKLENWDDKLYRVFGDNYEI